ncbi:MAG TPA: phosphomannomutase/phosphoglucomutase, partial [Eubacteriaceae bacterium]|nr:phosphomannomutase/phosphoglucomutase [Eubacteriaceae bacterium]
MDWMKLQNGSDIRGVALEGVEGEDVNLTPEVAQKISRAFALWLKVKTGKDSMVVSVGTDSRLSAKALSQGVVQGLKTGGAKVIDCGMASTPAMFMTTKDESIQADGAIMITASHLPFNRNGLKFFTKAGGAEKGDITEILQIASEGAFGPEEKGEVEKVDYISTYAKILLEKIRKASGKEKPFEGKKIIVDAGNGAGGFFASKVLKPLGADTKGSLYLEPDGRFPNHEPNPENREAMDAITQAVIETKADLGIIFDTDVDRAAVVDKGGKAINRNALIALLSAIVLKEHPKTTIVTDSVTSKGLKTFIESLGGTHHRFKRGYKNVINEAKRLEAEGVNAPLAIETSGHAAFKENYFLDDGAYLIAKILIK